PTRIQERMARADMLSRIRWARLSHDERLAEIRRLDFDKDPANAKRREYAWKCIGKAHDIERKIREWETKATPTPVDLDTQERRLAQLRADLERARSDELEADVVYVTYPAALDVLPKRIGAAVHELAAWVFYGPANGGIAAYSDPTQA